MGRGEEGKNMGWFDTIQQSWRFSYCSERVNSHCQEGVSCDSLTKEGTRKSRFCSEKTRQGMIRNISFQSSEQT